MFLGALIALLAGMEVVVRFGFSRFSKIEGRTESEYNAVLDLRNHPAGQSRNVLIVGSSLLLHAVDLPALRTQMGPEFKVTRYIVEQTAYLDWYYGMRKIYAKGVRPDAVVLLMSAGYMNIDDIRGDYFAYRLMRTQDFLRVSSDAELSPTATFSLLTGNLSALYGTRTETRKFVFSKLVPSLMALRPYLLPAPLGPRDPGSMVIKVADRMQQFDALVRGNGGRFIFLEAPTRDSGDVKTAQEAGSRAGVTVLTALLAEKLSETEFLDPSHMNEAGAAHYTQALAPLLSAKIKQVLP